jgi:hypothetical protein
MERACGPNIGKRNSGICKYGSMWGIGFCVGLLFKLDQIHETPK